MGIVNGQGEMDTRRIIMLTRIANGVLDINDVDEELDDGDLKFIESVKNSIADLEKRGIKNPNMSIPDF